MSASKHLSVEYVDGSSHQPTEPIVARMTPGGRGAVATVRFAGADGESVPFRAASGATLPRLHVGRVAFGRWGRAGEPVEEVVVRRIDARSFDVHCHGGDAAVQRILDDAATAGWRIVEWPVLLTEIDGRFRAECAEALAATTTVRTASILLDQTRRWHGTIEELAATDWHKAPSREQALARLDDVLRWAEFGRHLTRPWIVVLAGRPNVGKSSLINALVGYERSVVYHAPGTTRDLVEVETSIDGWPVRLSDTAGMRSIARGDTNPHAALEAAGIERARVQLGRADCVVLVFDRSRPLQADDRNLALAHPGAICVANKCDLPSAWPEGDSPMASDGSPIETSAVDNLGIDALLAAIGESLVPDPPSADAAVPFSERQIALLESARSLAVEKRYGECIEMLNSITG